MSASARRADDRGAVLIMALVIVVVLGVTVAAIAGFGAVSFRHTRVTRTQTDLRASADGGVRYQLEQMALGRPCLSSASLPIAVNDANIAVDCSFIAGAEPGANAWAVILTGLGTGPSARMLTSQSGGSGHKKINGPVFINTATPATDLKSQVEINDGDLWYHASTCPGTPPTFPTGELIITPAPPRTTICTASDWSDLAPAPPLPPFPTVVDPPSLELDPPGPGKCQVFYPGHYQAPPSLIGGPNDANYFVSGDYYFDFTGTEKVMNVDAPLIGGQLDPSGIDVPYLEDPSGPCANVLTEPTVAALEGPGNYGVTFVYGGASRLYVDTKGQMELFSRLQGDIYTSVMTVEAASGGYGASTLGASAAIVGMKEGNTNDMVTHALVYAPRARFQFGNVTNTAHAQVVGGLVVAAIDIDGSASASNFTIGADTQPAVTKTVIEATATKDGQSVTVRAVVDYRVNRIVTDAATNTAGTVTSAAAAFTSRDVGQDVSGEGIPGGAIITAVNSATQVTISPPPSSTGSGRTFIVKTPQVAVNSWRKV